MDLSLEFVTAWVGRSFDIEYPVKLYRAIERNYKKDFKFTIICDETNASRIIECNELKAATYYVDGRFPKWWSKIAWFNRRFRKSVFFDLDTIICDDISDIGNTIRGQYDFAILQNFLQPPVRNPELVDPSEYGSAVMFKSHFSTLYSIIYDIYLSNPENWQKQFEVGGDQKFIEYVISKYDMPIGFLQYSGFEPNYFRSVKYPEQLYAVPDRTKIICYHGLPRPHQDKENPIIKEHWI